MAMLAYIVTNVLALSAIRPYFPMSWTLTTRSANKQGLGNGRDSTITSYDTHVYHYLEHQTDQVAYWRQRALAAEATISHAGEGPQECPTPIPQREIPATAACSLQKRSKSNRFFRWIHLHGIRASVTQGLFQTAKSIPQSSQGLPLNITIDAADAKQQSNITATLWLASMYDGALNGISNAAMTTRAFVLNVTEQMLRFLANTYKAVIKLLRFKDNHYTQPTQDLPTTDANTTINAKAIVIDIDDNNNTVVTVNITVLLRKLSIAIKDWIANAVMSLQQFVHKTLEELSNLLDTAYQTILRFAGPKSIHYTSSTQGSPVNTTIYANVIMIYYDNDNNTVVTVNVSVVVRPVLATIEALNSNVVEPLQRFMLKTLEKLSHELDKAYKKTITPKVRKDLATVTLKVVKVAIRTLHHLLQALDQVSQVLHDAANESVVDARQTGSAGSKECEWRREGGLPDTTHKGAHKDGHTHDPYNTTTVELNTTLEERRAMCFKQP